MTHNAREQTTNIPESVNDIRVKGKKLKQQSFILPAAVGLAVSSDGEEDGTGRQEFPLPPHPLEHGPFSFL